MLARDCFQPQVAAVHALSDRSNVAGIGDGVAASGSPEVRGTVRSSLRAFKVSKQRIVEWYADGLGKPHVIRPAGQLNEAPAPESPAIALLHIAEVLPSPFTAIQDVGQRLLLRRMRLCPTQPRCLARW